MKNYIQEGNVLTLIAPAGGVVSGKAYLIGLLVVVASFSANGGEEFEGYTVGVFELGKAVADAPAQGDKAYWDDTGKEVTTVALNNTLFGVFTKAQANGDTTGHIRLGLVA